MATVKFLPKSSNPAARKPFPLRYWDDRGQHERSFVTSAERKDFEPDSSTATWNHGNRPMLFPDPHILIQPTFPRA